MKEKIDSEAVIASLINESIENLKKLKFEMGDSIYCFTEVLPNGRAFKIVGYGDLTWNIASGKQGLGYAVGLDGDYKNLSYFKVEEMHKHFILDYDLMKIKLRDKKINQLLDLDKYN
jgi:hypothetical protein